MSGPRNDSDVAVHRQDTEDLVRTRLIRSWGLATALVAVLAAAPVTFGPEPSLAARTRPPALAGSWYPEDRAQLVAGAHFLMRLAASAPTLSAKPVALVVPHAGWSYSGLAAATAFRSLKPGDFERVVVVAPSHTGLLPRLRPRRRDGVPHADRGRPALRRGSRGPAGRGRPSGAGSRRRRARGRDRAALPAGDARSVLPRARPRRGHGRRRRARVRGAARDTRRRPHPLRLLLRFRPLRPTLRLPAVRGIVACRSRAGPRDGRPRHRTPRERGRAGLPRLPAPDRQHDLRPPRPRHPAGAAAANRTSGPRRAPRPLRLGRPARD